MARRRGRRVGQRLRVAAESEDEQPPAAADPGSRRRIAPVERESPAPARGDRNELLAVDRVADGRGDDAGAGRVLPEELAGAGVVGGEAAGRRTLEDEQAGGREDAAVGDRVARDAPDLLLLHGIPREQLARGGLGRELARLREVDAGVAR